MNAKQSLKMCVVVLGATLLLQTSAVMAEVMTTGQMAAQNQTEAEKSRIQALVDREDVKVRLQALGVSESMAKVRVAAMTDQEVQVLAQKIDAMPAGGRLRDSDLVVILLIILLILVI
jgi:cytochrome b